MCTRRSLFAPCTRQIEPVTSRKQKVAVRGDSGVAGEGRVVGVPMFHSWDKCTMPLTNIKSDWMSNSLSGLCIILHFIIHLVYTPIVFPIEQLDFPYSIVHI